MKFDSVEDARSFYLGYARDNEFDIRATNLDYDKQYRVLRRKKVDEGDHAQTDPMGRNFIRGCQTFKYMVEQKLGYSKIGFTQKNMYNKIAKMRRSKAFESDSQATILYLKSKAFFEQNFYCRFNIDDDDSANNHNVTCVFAAALLLDSMFTSYKWVLTRLMNSMGNRYPPFILMEEDEAM
ncbi:hypothetical protein Ddye_008518 [Dipteronia dyeriana]|uniref:Protein FAR1-RELATED SEQUENCE n=1 Tax=Dipteronia dyeriana TaxID=168575 RepID=A0AAE0CLG0_9ROSI|nr:hypothetical protein Ddye_008518 [Dipteronia dyeriana]